MLPKPTHYSNFILSPLNQQFWNESKNLHVDSQN